ncbi:MAG: transglutaminase domain-containing protein [Nanoarchaeota archaeon]|nr:transglutaminase domain-containing protein [Nanoarchaeota archaeon]
MKKEVIAFLIVILVVPICYGQSIYNSEELDVKLIIDGGFEIKRESKDASIKYVTVNFSFFPKDDYRQRIIELDTVPDTEIEGSWISYRFDNPNYGEYEFGIEADVNLKNKKKEIKNKISFPLKSIPEEATEYTQPSLTADSDNNEIIRLANSLAEGEDDLFIVVHKLADWTKNNIQYNLSTLTASVSEPASWVLTNKRGVCDEITNLFIALCRSLGIPGRFVSGIAYTESELFSENWGPHGWAEVYFPGYGWVDYDVTYGEFGFIDVSHIKLKDSIDSQESSTKYSWLGRNVEVKSREMDIKTEVKKYSGIIDNNIDIIVESEKIEIGFNSYNMINVKIKNNNDYYVSEELSIHKTKETMVEGSNTMNVLLRPGEEKEVNWIINIGELEHGYVYTFPVSIRTSKNKTFKTVFTSEYSEAVFSREEIISLLNSRKQEREKKYSKDVNISCEIEKEEFYIYEDNKISCSIENKGNVFFEDMEICFKEQCKKLDLGISQQKWFEFEFNEQDSGKKEKLVEASAIDALKTELISYNVLDAPEINITEMNYPRNVRYVDEFTLEFLLKKESYSNPVDVEVTIDHDGYEKTWHIEEIDEGRVFMIDMKGGNLVPEKNDFEIEVKYKDKKGNIYNENELINIDLVDLKFGERVMVYLNILGRRVSTGVGMLWAFIFIAISFIIGFLIIFKKRKNE